MRRTTYASARRDLDEFLGLCRGLKLDTQVEDSRFIAYGRVLDGLIADLDSIGRNSAADWGGTSCWPVLGSPARCLVKYGASR